MKQEHNRPQTNTLGQQAEKLAERFLCQKGLMLKERNFNCKMGEIDLIMEDKNTLVFVEVRLRSNRQFGIASESITWKKQQKIIKAAQHYLLLKKLTDRKACRFDVIALASIGTTIDIQWLKDAFSSY